MKHIATAIAIAAALCAALYLEAKDRQWWANFSQSHNCTQVATIDGPGLQLCGPGLALHSLSGKTPWLCDDGLVYYR